MSLNKCTKPITLTTDFGLADGFVGIVRGVILCIQPDAAVVDLSHESPSWDVSSAAWIIWNSWRYFPPGTVHVGVVDPGVGSSRCGIAVGHKGHFFVGPDNGIFSRVLEQEDCQAVTLKNRSFWLNQVSNTFHARDIFAPVAAHLAGGLALEELGPKIDPGSLVRLPSPGLHIGETTIEGEVVYVDRFGNLITNVPSKSVPSGSVCRVEGMNLGMIQDTYSCAALHRAVPVRGSHGCIEIAVNSGSAKDLLGLSRGARVLIAPALQDD